MDAGDAGEVAYEESTSSPLASSKAAMATIAGIPAFDESKRSALLSATAWNSASTLLRTARCSKRARIEDLVALVLLANVPSRRVAEKVRCEAAGEVEHAGLPHLLLRLKP